MRFTTIDFYLSAGFSLNGALLYDSSDSSIAFHNIKASEGFVPAITLFAGERAQINFGLKLEQNVHFEIAGYKPLCSHSTLQYNIPLWYSYHGGFKSLREPKHQNTSKLETRPTTSGLMVLAQEWDDSMQSEQEVLRLNMGFTVISSSNPPLTPTLVPRPGVLSPMPLPENANFTLEGGLGLRSNDAPISFSVVFPAGQVPSAVFLGWTTPSFRYSPSQFSSKEEEKVDNSISTHHSGVRHGQCLEAYSDSSQGTAEVVSSLQTAFMVCLCDILPVCSALLVIPVKYVCVVTCFFGHVLLLLCCCCHVFVSFVVVVCCCHVLLFIVCCFVVCCFVG